MTSRKEGMENEKQLRRWSAYFWTSTDHTVLIFLMTKNIALLWLLCTTLIFHQLQKSHSKFYFSKNMGDIAISRLHRSKHDLGICTQKYGMFLASSSEHMNNTVSPSEIWKISPRPGGEAALPASARFFILPRARRYFSYSPRRSRLDPKNLYFFSHKNLCRHLNFEVQKFTKKESKFAANQNWWKDWT